MSSSDQNEAVTVLLDGAFQQYKTVGQKYRDQGWAFGHELFEAAARYCTATKLLADDSMATSIEEELDLIESLIELCEANGTGEEFNSEAIPTFLKPYCSQLLTRASKPDVQQAEMKTSQIGPEETQVETSQEEMADLPDDVDPESFQMFVGEVQDHFANIEPSLLSLENDPDDKEALNSIFRGFHTIKGCAGFLDLKDVIRVTHEAETLLDLARDGKLILSPEIIDLILKCVDVVREQVDSTREWVQTGVRPKRHRLMNTMVVQLKQVASGDTSTLQKSARQEVEVKVKSESQPAGEPTTSAQQSGEAESAGRDPNKSKAASIESVKVDKSRLDQLIDLIGELVIAESMVSSEVSRSQTNSSESTRKLSQLRKITRELQELSLSLRMVPINGLFQRMARMIRDLSRKLGKDVDYEILGGETDLDKNIIEQVADPLVHIIRNSLDHGIEPTSNERIKAGKSAKAKITLRAFYRGGNIYIEIEDDGRGLNQERITAKAISQGIIKTAEGMTESEINNLIFAPGFSTAAEVTDLSGRGVGMDVVRRNIDALRGSVAIQSRFGHGTTVSLCLPLTLAIIDGMVVKVADQRFIVPTLSILQQIRPARKDLVTIQGQGEMLSVRGHNIPFFRLAELFNLSKERTPPEKGTIVLVEVKEKTIGLLVDDIIGQQQVVIKQLGHGMDGLPGVSGGAVLPDGQVGVILDMYGLLQLARSYRKTTPPRSDSHVLT